MRDWKEYLRGNLRLRKCGAEREAEVVEELAEQMEEVYAEELVRGANEEDATAAAMAQVLDWDALAREIDRGGSVRGRRRRLVESGATEMVSMRSEAVSVRARIEMLKQDLRYALRMLGKKPLFTAVAILTLAIGIGANVAIFSVVNSVLLERLPYPQSQRLAVVWSEFGGEGRAPAAAPEVVSIRERSKSFEEVAGIWVQGGALTGKGEPEQVKLGLVTANFPELLSAKPAVGRFFVASDEGNGRAPVVLLTNELWQRRYGGDPKIVGKQVMLSGRSCTVVGVLPAGFRLIFPEGASVPAKVDVYVPFPWDLAKQPRDQGYVRVIGRLREGVNVAQAQSELDGIAAELRKEFKEYSEENLRLQVVPLKGDVDRAARRPLLALFAGTGFVLLIACANVAMLLLGSANERRAEITVRAALGADAGRIIRQLLTESVMLSVLGGVAAVVVSWGMLKVLWVLQPAGIARRAPAGLNFTVLGFALLVSVACGILFGLSPAFEARRVNFGSVLREGSQGGGGVRKFSRELLIGCEVALTFVLLTSAVLLIRTFVDVLHVSPGFNAANVLTFQVALPEVGYTTNEKAVNFIREAQRTVAGISGVESVGVVSHLPFDDGLPNWYDYYWREGAPKDEQNQLMADHRSVLPGFFDSLGIEFVAGRNFGVSDEVGNRKVAIIDDELAKQLWPGADAVGKLLNVENGDFVRDKAEVVGVVRHIQFHSLTNSVRPQIYLRYPMAVRVNMSFTVRSKMPREALAPLIQKEIAGLDPDLPVANVRMMDEYVESARMESRFVAVLCGVLGGIALLLSCIGIYGVTSSAVMSRTREIGIRMALGAQRGQIRAMVLRGSMVPVALGAAAGLVMAVALMPMLGSLLFGVKPVEPAVMVLVMLVMCGVGVGAAMVPAERVVSGDVVGALRWE